MAVASFLVLVAALTPSALRDDTTIRNLVPLAVASAAPVIGVLNLSGGAWLMPLLLPVLVVGHYRKRRAFLPLTVGFVALVAILSTPSLLLANSFRSDVSLNAKGGDPGNLIQPLSLLQALGIWPVGDFRLRPPHLGPTYVLMLVLVAAAAMGLWWAYRRGTWEVLLYVVASLIGCAMAVRVGSSWIAAKGLAIASPAMLVAGMAGVAWLYRGGRRIEASVALVAIAGGVLWSNALAYHDVWLAPRSQLTELETIGNTFAGAGPTLMTEYQPYGVRYFLRRMDPEGAGELRRRPVLLRNGQQ